MSESLSEELDPDFLENVIMEAADKVMHDEMDDHTRVILYRLALTVAAEEMVRIEQDSGGSVKPEVLMLLQQISLLCDDKTDRDKLIQNARAQSDRANEFLEAGGDSDGDEENGGPSIVTPGEVRAEE